MNKINIDDDIFYNASIDFLIEALTQDSIEEHKRKTTTNTSNDYEKVELYHTLYSPAPKVLNKNFSFLLQSKVVDGKYAEAIALIEKEQGKNNPSCSLYQVRDMYYKAKCYKQMGDLEKAKPCFDYVIDNGGDLMYKQFAIELYEQMNNLEKSC